MAKAIAVSAGGTLRRVIPSPPPTLKRVVVDLKGTNRITAAGLNSQLASADPIAGIGLVMLKTRLGLTARTSLSQYFGGTAVPGATVTSEFALVARPTPNPSDPVMSSEPLGADIACMGGGTEPPDGGGLSC